MSATAAHFSIAATRPAIIGKTTCSFVRSPRKLKNGQQLKDQGYWIMPFVDKDDKD